jgi:hypothetical protein
MAKIQVTLDASKLRTLVSKRTYKNKDGQEVEVQEVKFELVEVKEPKTIYTADKYRIDKTHFASVIQTKEEREAKAETIYIGEGFTTVWSNAETVTYVATPIKEVENLNDLPF